MNPDRSGLSTAGKAGIIVILAILVLGAIYVAPSLTSGGGTTSTSSHSTGSSSTLFTGDQTIELLSLFGYFSQMQIHVASYDHSEGNALIEQHTLGYQVLGKGSLNSTQYTRVQFTQEGEGTNLVAWFNPQGGIDRVDVPGVRNYTGATASVYAQIYVATFSIITGVSNNSTLLSLLSKTSQAATTIGSTALDVATYALKAPTPPYTNVTVKYASIPGTNLRFAVYFDENTSDLTETTVQVLSITK